MLKSTSTVSSSSKCNQTLEANLRYVDSPLILSLALRAKITGMFVFAAVVLALVVLFVGGRLGRRSRRRGVRRRRRGVSGEDGARGKRQQANDRDKLLEHRSAPL